MMTVDERTERLIVRRLDGELTPDEEHELNQILLTSAEARRMMIDYQQDDDLAGDVIADGVDGRWSVADESTNVRNLRTPWFWGPVAGGFAAAAVIVLMLVGPAQVDPGAPSPSLTEATERVASGNTVSKPRLPTPEPIPAIDHMPHLGRRHVDRELIGVLNDAGDKILLFEVNRTRTLRIPVTGDL